MLQYNTLCPIYKIRINNKLSFKFSLFLANTANSFDFFDDYGCGIDIWIKAVVLQLWTNLHIEFGIYITCHNWVACVRTDRKNSLGFYSSYKQVRKIWHKFTPSIISAYAIYPAACRCKGYTKRKQKLVHVWRECPLRQSGVGQVKATGSSALSQEPL